MSDKIIDPLLEVKEKKKKYILESFLVGTVAAHLLIANFAYHNLERSNDEVNNAISESISTTNELAKKLDLAIQDGFSTRSSETTNLNAQNTFATESYDIFMTRFESYIKNIESLNKGSIYVMPTGQVKSQFSTEFTAIGSGEDIARLISDKIRTTNKIYSEETPLHHIARIQLISSEIDQEKVLIKENNDKSGGLTLKETNQAETQEQKDINQ